MPLDIRKGSESSDSEFRNTKKFSINAKREARRYEEDGVVIVLFRQLLSSLLFLIQLTRNRVNQAKCGHQYLEAQVKILNYLVLWGNSTKFLLLL